MKHWQCTCGRWNGAYSEKCWNCGMKKEDLPIKQKEDESMAEKKEKKPKAKNDLGAKIIGVMQGLLANGVTETNSTVLKDKLKTKNRAVIRKAMKGLVKEGKIVIEEKPRGKRKQYIYKLA